MSTTTIRLPEELKARVAAAAEHAGTTSHNFILQAIAEKTEQEEQCRTFNDIADQRYANIIASEKAIPWHEMRTYLEGSMAGETVKLPSPANWVAEGGQHRTGP